jgi:hypothetical protein
MDTPPVRIPFLKIIEQHSLSIELVARFAGISPWSVFYMANEDAVDRKTAEKTLEAVSQLTGETYTLDNVTVLVGDLQQPMLEEGT